MRPTVGSPAPAAETALRPSAWPFITTLPPKPAICPGRNSIEAVSGSTSLRRSALYAPESSLAIGIGELGAFDPRMDEIRIRRIDALEAVAFEQRQHLQQHGALRPRTGFEDTIAAVVVVNRGLDRRLPAGHVLAGEDAPVRAA